MEDVSDVNELMTRLRSRLRTPGCLVIAVDGALGAGKSTLARAVAEELGGRVISLDDAYLEKHTGAYRSSVRHEALYEDVERFRTEERVVVIEGICLLEILEAAGVTADVAIYVKRIDQSGSWADAEICDHTRGLDTILEGINSFEQAASTPGAYDLQREVAEYHCKRGPLQEATFAFRRVDG